MRQHIFRSSMFCLHKTTIIEGRVRGDCIDIGCPRGQERATASWNLRRRKQRIVVLTKSIWVVHLPKNCIFRRKRIEACMQRRTCDLRHVVKEVTKGWGCSWARKTYKKNVQIAFRFSVMSMGRGLNILHYMLILRREKLFIKMEWTSHLDPSSLLVVIGGRVPEISLRTTACMLL